MVNKVSDLELAILKVCWKKGEVSVRDIFEVLLKDREITYNTIKTTMERMVKKEYLTKRMYGPLGLYKQQVSQKRLLSKYFERFSENILDNNLIEFVSYFVDKKKISQKEVDDIRSLLDNYEEE